MQFTPVYRRYLEVIASNRLDGIAVALAARLVTHWRTAEASTRFDVDSQWLAAKTGLAGSTVRRNLELMASDTANVLLLYMRPTPLPYAVDIQAFREAQFPGVPPISGRVSGLGGRDLWTMGLRNARPGQWSVVPDNAIELLTTSLFPKPATWAVLYAIVFLHGLPPSRESRISTRAVSELLGMPVKTVQNAFRRIVEAGLLQPDAGVQAEDAEGGPAPRRAVAEPRPRHRPPVTYHLAPAFFEGVNQPERWPDIVARARANISPHGPARNGPEPV